MVMVLEGTPRSPAGAAGAAETVAETRVLESDGYGVRE
jgi:hypothetical protein